MSSTTPAITHHYLTLLNHCLSAPSLHLTQLLHSRLLTSGLLLSSSSSSSHRLFLTNNLIRLYSALNHLPSSISLFHSIPEPNLVSYNTLISSLSRHGLHSSALRLFAQMPFPPDPFNVVAVASACSALGFTKLLKLMHACAIVSTNIEINVIVSNVFVSGYGKCGPMELARTVFDQMPKRDVVSWTSLVSGYARGGRLGEAKDIFQAMPIRNEVSWTALISGYEQNGEEEKAIELFKVMVEEGVEPRDRTIVSVLSSCAGLGLVGRGKQVHGYVVRSSSRTRRRLSNVFVDNALVDMYAKCGDMVSASKVFEYFMPEHDVVSWNSMVTGFAHSGLGVQSLEVFERMIAAGINPNHVTFIGVLSACSHAGLVSEGRQFLDSMEETYGVTPSSEHYAALVDALGRKKQLREATELVERLNLHNAGIWGALLGACQVHGDLERGKRAAEALFALEPDNGARYVTLSNIYASVGEWNEVKRVRMVMKRKGLRKDAGHSWIEVRSVKHVFGVEDDSHSQREEIHKMLHVLADQMMEEETHMFFALEGIT